MDNMIAAVIIILCVLVFTCFNSVYICSLCDDMISYAESGDIDKAYGLWNEKKDYISIFVRDAEIDAVDAAAKKLGNDEGDHDAEARKLVFIDAVDEIKNSEKPSLEDIF